MRYKIVVKDGFNTFVKKRSRSKNRLMKYAENLSKRHPRWKVYVVHEETTI